MVCWINIWLPLVMATEKGKALTVLHCRTYCAETFRWNHTVCQLFWLDVSVSTPNFYLFIFYHFLFIDIVWSNIFFGIYNVICCWNVSWHSMIMSKVACTMFYLLYIFLFTANIQLMSCYQVHIMILYWIYLVTSSSLWTKVVWPCVSHYASVNICNL